MISDLGCFQEFLEVRNLEVADTDAPKQWLVSARPSTQRRGYALGFPVSLDLLHLRPGGRDVRGCEPGAVNEVEVDIVNAQLRV